MPKPSLPDAWPGLAAPEKPFSQWSHTEYVNRLSALGVIPPMVAAMLIVFCEREKALAVNAVLQSHVNPEGEANHAV